MAIPPGQDIRRFVYSVCNSLGKSLSAAQTWTLALPEVLGSCNHSFIPSIPIRPHPYLREGSCVPEKHHHCCYILRAGTNVLEIHNPRQHLVDLQTFIWPVVATRYKFQERVEKDLSRVQNCSFRHSRFVYQTTTSTVASEVNTLENHFPRQGFVDLPIVGTQFFFPDFHTGACSILKS